MSKKELTERQRKSHEMRAAGRSWEEIGAEMGITSQGAAKLAAKAVSNGLPALMKNHEGSEVVFKAPPGEEPEFDREAFLSMVKSIGVPLKIAQALARRLAGQFAGAKVEFKRMSLAEQVTATTEKAQMLLSYIDEVGAAGAGLKDLTIAYGVLTDKALLLGGKPTQIVDFNMRAKLEVLMPAFMAEARRRGVTVEGEARRLPEATDG